MSELGKVCAHEQLERQCPICERDIEISRLKDMELFYKAELEHAKEALAEREHESETWKWKSHFWRGESDEKDRKIASLESKLAEKEQIIKSSEYAHSLSLYKAFCNESRLRILSLNKIIATYGYHKFPCGQQDDKNNKCSCGFDEALKDIA